MFKLIHFNLKIDNNKIEINLYFKETRVGVLKIGCIFFCLQIDRPITRRGYKSWILQYSPYMKIIYCDREF